MSVSGPRKDTNSGSSFDASLDSSMISRAPGESSGVCSSAMPVGAPFATGT